MKEEFRDIKGYEGLYLVSNLGNVKSLKNNIILKPHNNSRDYFQVSLYKEKKRKIHYLHRLVAEAFIPNPKDLPCINHLDENKQNNCVQNLEYCSYLNNNIYGTRIKRITEKTSKPIKCLDLETNEITYYPSINEAARFFNVSTLYFSVYKSKKPYKNRYIFSIVS